LFFIEFVLRNYSKYIFFQKYCLLKKCYFIDIKRYRKMKKYSNKILFKVVVNYLILKSEKIKFPATKFYFLSMKINKFANYFLMFKPK